MKVLPPGMVLATFPRPGRPRGAMPAPAPQPPAGRSHSVRYSNLSYIERAELAQTNRPLFERLRAEHLAELQGPPRVEGRRYQDLSYPERAALAQVDPEAFERLRSTHLVSRETRRS